MEIRKILLVDDDEATLYLNEILLRRAGIEAGVLTARSGREALDIIRTAYQDEQCPELILLDINMPVMDGFEFLEALQQSDDLSATPFKIVMLSSSTHRLDKEKVNRYPVVDYIQKPLTLEKLFRFL